MAERDLLSAEGPKLSERTSFPTLVPHHLFCVVRIDFGSGIFELVSVYIVAKLVEKHTPQKPFLVKAKCSQVAFEVASQQARRSSRVHKSRLKRSA